MNLITQLTPHPKKQPRASGVPVAYLSCATSGAWAGYLAFHPEVREWIKEVKVDLKLAADGIAPCCATVTLKVASDEGGMWEAERSEEISKFAEESDNKERALRREITAFVITETINLINVRKLSLQQAKDKCADLLGHEINEAS